MARRLVKRPGPGLVACRVALEQRATLARFGRAVPGVCGRRRRMDGDEGVALGQAFGCTGMV